MMALRLAEACEYLPAGEATSAAQQVDEVIACCDADLPAVTLALNRDARFLTSVAKEGSSERVTRWIIDASSG